MLKRKEVFRIAVCLTALLTAVFCLSALGAQESVCTAASISNPSPSTGFYLLADKCRMDKTGLVGSEIVFTPDDFSRALNLSSLREITVTSIPPVTDGELRIGSNKVCAGQRIVRGELDRLAFVPAHAGIRESRFTFRVGDCGYDMMCALHLTDTPNAAPVIEEGEQIDGICAHMSYRGRLVMCDPEGDSIRVMTVSPPRHGSLILTDAAAGEYLYRPAADYAGEDRFAVVAVDSWGNMSAQMWVEVRVGVCEGE